MKKLISLVMSLVLLVCIFTAKSVSAYNNEEYKYELLNDGSIMITEYLGNDSEVNIPSKIDGKNVTAIEFNGRAYTKITEITIPHTVTKVEGYVFSYMDDNFININVDKNNKKLCSIDGVLFNKKQTELICYPHGREDKSYRVPEGVKVIGAYAFYLSNLNSIYLPDSVETIKHDAFYKSANLTEIRMSKNLKTIESIAFAKTKIQKLFLPPSVKTVKSLAFGRSASTANATHKEPFVIYGYKNSYIHKYCKKHKIEYMVVDPAAPKKTTVRGAKGKITVNYKKVKKAKGFQIKAVSGKKKVVKAYKTEKSAKKSLKGLKKGTYKVKVRAFNTYNGEKIYGPWAKAKTVTVK